MSVPRNATRGNPAPQVFQGAGAARRVWAVDLRRWGFGQRYHLGPADGSEALTETDALNAAWALLRDLEREEARGGRPADELPLGAPVTLAGLLDLWAKRKRYDGPDAARWGGEYTGLVRGELGNTELSSLLPPAGSDVLLGYLDRLRGKGYGARSIRNRFSVLMQAIRFAVERGWLRAAPARPGLPEVPAPVFRWITEAMFRALYADMLRDATVLQFSESRTAKACAVTDPATLAIYIAKRRAYASWLFYTGHHRRDADKLTSDWLFLDGGAYIRHNSKSSKSVPDEQFEMPEPLVHDLRALEKALGRPFLPGELVTGGTWHNASRALNRSAKRLGFPHGAGPAILRRSYAREMFLRGYDVDEVADRMGHVDRRMLQQIYVRTPRPAGRVRTRWLMPAPGAAPQTPSGMAEVLPFVPVLEGRRPALPAPGRPQWLRRKERGE